MARLCRIRLVRRPTTPTLDLLAYPNMVIRVDDPDGQGSTVALSLTEALVHLCSNVGSQIILDEAEPYMAVDSRGPEPSPHSSSARIRIWRLDSGELAIEADTGMTTAETEADFAADGPSKIGRSRVDVETVKLIS